MEFITSKALRKLNFGYTKSNPYEYIVIDNFLKKEYLEGIINELNNLKDDKANSKFADPKCKLEYNKYGFSQINEYGENIKRVFNALLSKEFVKLLEKFTKIENLITNNLEHAGIHRIKKGGFLELHTDFNSYKHEKHGLLDRRINLLLYLNPKWKEEYKGHFMIANKKNKEIVDKILPILNRCVIFNTTKDSLHGHPERLLTPDNISRQSFALYYYSKNNGKGVDFEGDKPHNTVFYDYNQFKKI